MHRSSEATQLLAVSSKAASGEAKQRAARQSSEAKQRSKAVKPWGKAAVSHEAEQRSREARRRSKAGVILGVSSCYAATQVSLPSQAIMVGTAWNEAISYMATSSGQRATHSEEWTSAARSNTQASRCHRAKAEVKGARKWRDPDSFRQEDNQVPSASLYKVLPHSNWLGRATKLKSIIHFILHTATHAINFYGYIDETWQPTSCVNVTLLFACSTYSHNTG